MKKIRKYAALMIAGTVVLGACGSDEKTESTTAATSAATTATTAAAPTTAAATETTAESTETSAGSGDVDCKPIKPGVLTVVTSLPGPNFWGTPNLEIDPNAIESGIEFDLANIIAEKCGLTMEFRNESFDAIVAGQIPDGSYDIVLSQVTITEDRAEVVDFSVGYFLADQGLLVPTGTEVGTWEEVKAMNIGVQATTTAEYYFLEIPEWKLDNDIKSFPDLTSAYESLSSGQIDGVVIDTPINLGQAAQSNGELEVVAQFKTGDEYGAIFPKGSDRKAIFDPVIQGLIDDGTVNGLIAKYLGGDPSTVPYIEVG